MRNGEAGVDAPSMRETDPGLGRHKRSYALIGGIAGLTYVALAALESADVLAAPELGDRAATIRAYVESHSDALPLTSTAGLVSLVAYAVFAVCLFVWLQPSRASRIGGSAARAWPVVGLIGALFSALVAAVGQGAAAAVYADADTMNDDDLQSLWDLSIDLRTWAGAFGALGLIGFGRAIAVKPVVPRKLGHVAVLVGAALLLATVVAVADGEERTRLVVVAVFGLAAIWLLLVAAWLVLGHEITAHPVVLVRQLASIVLVMAAGVTGFALLLLPGTTNELFSWGLAPRPVVALVAAFYLASAVVFAVALRSSRARTRALIAGAFVFASTTVVVTLAHTEVFDFDRLQAVAWVVLFPLFALVMAFVLVAEPAPASDDGPGVPIAPSSRFVAGVLAAAYAFGAIVLWADPRGVADVLPFALTPMGGRFLGCWLALLAVLAVSIAAGTRKSDAPIASVALVGFPLGALVAAARVPTDLEGAGETTGYVVVLALALVAGAWLAIRGVGERT